MKLLHVAGRNILRRPTRTLLMTLGVAVAIFIFSALLSLDRGLKRMVERTGSDLVLTVFERFKACPPYSRLPVHYRDKIAAIPHVRDVMPVRFVLSNCQTTTDLVAVHGIEPGKFRRFREIEIPEADYQSFAAERGAAIVGRSVASKYGWRVGDQVTLKELRGVSFTVRGIFEAPGSALQSIILVDREYLEYSIEQVGLATMFLVLVDGPAHVDSVSAAVDGEFANFDTQTKTGPEKSFIAGSIKDFGDMVRFAQIVAYVSLAMLLLAVANSVSMNVRDRLREMAILKTLGYRRAHVARLVLVEALALALAGAVVGIGATALLVGSGVLAISVEGYTIVPHLSHGIGALALLMGGLLAVLGGYAPARRAARLPIVTALREVD